MMEPTHFDALLQQLATLKERDPQAYLALLEKVQEMLKELKED